MLSLIKRLLNRLAQKREKRRHDKIVNEYRSFATGFGDALSYGYLGEPNVLASSGKWLSEQECWDELDRLEVEYASLGYRVISIDEWISHGGYAKNIDHLWLVERVIDERPIYTRDLMRKEREDVN
jgi:hypothetical protein